MGFRNPFRITVDEDGVAYVTDYSPDSRTPQLFRGPAGTGRLDRAQAGELRLAALLLAGPAVLPVELQHLHAARRPAASRTSATTRRAGRRTRRGGTRRPESTASAADPSPEIWYSYQDNDAASPLGTPCLA